MLNQLDALLRFQQQALDLREQRQQMLAANIANADTPGYQARDVDFSRELKKALSTNSTAQTFSMATTSPRHIKGETHQPQSLDLLWRVPDQPALDGNTVDMDRERAQFMDNALKYQSSLTMLNGQLKGMMSVLQSGN